MVAAWERHSCGPSASSCDDTALRAQTHDLLSALNSLNNLFAYTWQLPSKPGPGGPGDQNPSRPEGPGTRLQMKPASPPKADS